MFQVENDDATRQIYWAIDQLKPFHNSADNDSEMDRSRHKRFPLWPSGENSVQHLSEFHESVLVKPVFLQTMVDSNSKSRGSIRKGHWGDPKILACYLIPREFIETDESFLVRAHSLIAPSVKWPSIPPEISQRSSQKRQVAQ